MDMGNVVHGYLSFYRTVTVNINSKNCLKDVDVAFLSLGLAGFCKTLEIGRLSIGKPIFIFTYHFLLILIKQLHLLLHEYHITLKYHAKAN